MTFFTRDQLNELMQIRQFPSVSFYLPVEKVTNDSRQGATVLRKMLKSAEDSLKEKGVRTPDINTLLQPAYDLLDNAIYWENQNLGLALFLSKESMTEYKLPIRFAETMLVADRYLVRPLLNMLGQDGRYAILALSLNEAKLHICTRFSVVEVIMTPDPTSLAELKSTYEYNSTLSRTRFSAGSSTHGGYLVGGSQDHKDDDRIRTLEYFRLVDQSLKKTLLDDKMPIVLACVDHLANRFREVAKDPRIQAKHISGSADQLKKDDLLDQGWKIVRPIFERDKNKAVETMRNSLNSDLLLYDIKKILMAASHGQVETLFLQEGKTLNGSVERGQSPYSASDGPTSVEEEELFDFAATRVMAHGGNVFVLPVDELPVATDCVAMLRYPLNS